MRIATFNLLNWSDAQGRTTELVCMAFEAVPGNADLRAVAAEFNCAQWQSGGDEKGTTSVPVEESRPQSVNRGRTAMWAVAGCFGVVILEYLNREYLHVLVLYPHMRTTGTLWALLTALASFAHPLGAPSKRWRLGLAVSLAFVILFLLLGIILIRSSDINPYDVEWLLPGFYGCSFGSLAWTFTAALGVERAADREERAEKNGLYFLGVFALYLTVILFAAPAVHRASMRSASRIDPECRFVLVDRIPTLITPSADDPTHEKGGVAEQAQILFLDSLVARPGNRLYSHFVVSLKAYTSGTYPMTFTLFGTTDRGNKAGRMWQGAVRLTESTYYGLEILGEPNDASKGPSIVLVALQDITAQRLIQRWKISVPSCETLPPNASVVSEN